MRELRGQRKTRRGSKRRRSSGRFALFLTALVLLVATSSALAGSAAHPLADGSDDPGLTTGDTGSTDTTATDTGSTDTTATDTTGSDTTSTEPTSTEATDSGSSDSGPTISAAAADGAVITAPSDASVDASVTFDASESTFPVGAPVPNGWHWTFTNSDADESFTDDGETVQETFDAPGTWQIDLEVTNGTDMVTTTGSVGVWETVGDTYNVGFNEVLEVNGGTGATQPLVANDSRPAADVPWDVLIEGSSGPTIETENGEITDFDPAAGTFDYTAHTGFEGNDTFTYTLVHGAFQSTPATVTIHVTGVSAPSNDDFENAQLVSESSGSVEGSNANATTQDGEPGDPSNTVWYRWTPAQGGTATFELDAGEFNPRLTGYSGDASSALDEIETVDTGTADGTHAQLTFAAETGTTYFVQVDTTNEETGAFDLSWSEQVPSSIDPLPIAQAMMANPSLVTGASFVAVPSNNVPDAVFTTQLTGFPTNGPSYAVLTSGQSSSVAQPGTFASTDDGSENARNTPSFADHDATILKVDLAVPAGANCLSFDFRFLSEEYPVYVGSTVNDGFVAELDNSTWSTSDGSTINAPDNFAFDTEHNVISVNTTGLSPANGAGTAFDGTDGDSNGGATSLLHASSPITPGNHSLYLSIFDQGDGVLDSAVFIDDLVVGTTAAGSCQAGATALTLTKTADAASAVAGSADGYTITAHNPTGSAVTLSSISDLLANGFSYVPASTSGPTESDPTIDGQSLTWTGPFTVPANGDLSLHFGATVSDAAGDYFDNASVTVTSGGSVSTGDTAKVTVTPAAESADLALTKTAAPDPVTVGSDLTYTLTATNNGPDAATGVTISDPLPANVSVVPAQTDELCSGTTTVTCALGSLDNGAQRSATIVVHVDSLPTGGTLENTASVSADQPDATPDNNSDTATTTVGAAAGADLGLTSTPSPNPATVGGALTYTLTATNSGPDPATGVTITDTLPDGVNFQSAQVGDTDCAHSGATVTCTLGSLAADGSGTATIVVVPTATGSLTNNATVAGNETDPNTDDNAASSTVSVNPVAGGEIDSAGPLSRIAISPQLNCDVSHTGDSSPEFFGGTACGTLLATGGTLYGPTDIPAGSSASPRTSFTAMSQSAVTGAGTASNPFKIVTVVDAGTTGLRLTQTDTYVVGQESYRTDVKLTNSGNAARSVIVYRAGDCFLANSDAGFGSLDLTTGAVACVGVNSAGTGPGSRIEQWFPLTSGSRAYEAGFSTVWSQIGQQLAFPNTCLCDQALDNGSGLSWSLSVAAGGSTTVSHLTTFSPVGNLPLSITATADTANVSAGSADGYTVQVHNPNSSAVTLTSLTADLAAGFSYTAGSTTGATTTNPTIDGQALTWSNVDVPASGNASLHFGVTTSSTPGTYTIDVSGVAGSFAVAPSGDTAQITVGEAQQPPLQISGIVRNSDADGAPLSGATVKACLVGATECHTAPATGEDGAYAVTGLHSGTWTVRATPPTTDLLSAAKQVTLDGEDATQDFALSANAPDLRMTLVVTPSSPQVGQKVTFMYTLQNVGPADATNVAFQATFPSSATFDSTTFTQPEALRARTLAAVSEPCTDAGGGQLLCNLGTIPSQATRTLGVVVIPSTSGPLTSNATLGSDQTVADPVSNQLTIGTPAATPPASSPSGSSGSPAPPLNPPPLPPPPSGPPLPDPIAGVNANVIPVAGVVLVNGVPLTAGEQIPLGAVIDATNGIVIITAIGADGTPQTSYFFGGAFIIVQAGPGAVPELVLQGGDFTGVCGTAQRLLSAKVPKAKPKAKPKLKRVTKKVVRSLWGEGTGKFRTRGRYSAATVRGTFWLTADRCDGTLTRVEEGVVSVLDIPKKKTILVTAGHSYLAVKPGTTTK